MTNTPETSTLGQSVAFPSSYDAGLLFPIPRTEARSKLGLDEALPFVGVDLWNAYELSWLDLRGKPQVALAEFRVPATSPNLVESKSFKLYLNSFAQERLANADALRATLIADLSAAAGLQRVRNSIVLATGATLTGGTLAANAAPTTGILEVVLTGGVSLTKCRASLVAMCFAVAGLAARSSRTAAA